MPFEAETRLARFYYPAGFSVLLNTLIGDDRALVSDITGTTRDTIEASPTLADGTLLRLVDTAGLRNTTDRVEQMVIDSTDFEAQYARFLRLRQDTAAPADAYTLIVASKADFLTPEAREDLTRRLAALTDTTDSVVPPTPRRTSALVLSAHDPADVQRLTESISRAVAELHHTADAASDVIVSNARHYECLTLTLEALRRVEAGLASDSLPADLLAQDLREALHHLGEITGEVTTDEVLQTIFSKFCIGK